MSIGSVPLFDALEKERDTIFRELEQLLPDSNETEQVPTRPLGDLFLGNSIEKLSSSMSDTRSYCPPTLLDYSTDLPPAVYWMGSQRISVCEGDRAYLVQIRPDISHDIVVALVEQVLMTNCGVVKIVEATHGIGGGGKTTFEVQACLECASLRCYIGVTRDRQRGNHHSVHFHSTHNPCLTFLTVLFSLRRFAPHGTSCT